jgi:hypothetical protein
MFAQPLPTNPNEEEIVESDEVCHVVDFEEVNCPLCKLNSKDAIIMKMNTMEESLTGKIAPAEIYKTLFGFYQHQKQELERQCIPCPVLSEDDIIRHYEKHKVNLKNIVANEIFLANEMQKHFAAEQMATRDINGKKTLHSKSVDQWIRISRHKLDLVKYYQSLSKKKVNEPSSIKPMEFD